MATIQDIKKKFRNEWVLGEVLDEDEKGQPKIVKVVAHSKDRSETYKAMKKHIGKHICHFYAGEIPDKGYAAAFII